MKILNTLKKEWYILVILLLPYLLIPFIWNEVPDRIPTRFGFDGEVNSYGSKIWIGASLLLLILAFFLPAELYAKLFFGGVMVMAIVPLAYSFWLFKRQPEN